MIRIATIMVKPAATNGCHNGTPPTVNLVTIMMGADNGKILNPTANGEWGLIASNIEKK
jgi:hypothetical protein